MLRGKIAGSGITRKILRVAFFVVALSTFNFQLSTLAGCTRVETIYRENSVKIDGKPYTINRLLWQPSEMVYLPDEATEQSVALKVMAQGATIAVEIPLRLAGKEINLASREKNPRPEAGSVYYTFHLSVRGDENGEGAAYYPIVSWGTKKEEDEGIPYGGKMTLTRGTTDNEWALEWVLTDNGNGKTISTGYIEREFERI